MTQPVFTGYNIYYILGKNDLNHALERLKMINEFILFKIIVKLNHRLKKNNVYNIKKSNHLSYKIRINTGSDFLF